MGNAATSLLRTSPDFSLSKPAFIGYTDVGTYGKFRWMTGETFLSFEGKKFEKLVPSVSSGYHGHRHRHNSHTKHCVVLAYTKIWELMNCDSKQLALCEF